MQPLMQSTPTPAPIPDISTLGQVFTPEPVVRCMLRLRPRFSRGAPARELPVRFWE